MTQKTEGYIELEWTCPNCQSNNSGPKKTCQSCGSPQPSDVTFHLPGEAKLKTDEATAQMAAAGPDSHCRFTHGTVHASQRRTGFAEASNSSTSDRDCQPFPTQRKGTII